MKSFKTIFALLLVSIILPSCSKTEENVPLTLPIQQIDVDNIARPASLINQEIPFKVVTADGTDVTSISTFYVDGQQITGSIFSSSVIGDFEVYAEYEDNGTLIVTNTESFSVIIPKQKIVVEDYTGTWCGFCPRVTAAIHELEQVTDDIVVVAIHETAASFPDPMHFPQVQILKNAFNVQGFPAARINRDQNWASPHPTTDVTSIAGVDTDLAISINSELNGSQLQLQVNVVYEQGSVMGDKLVVYLVEDGILYDQVNYYNADPTSPYYQQGNVIPNFVHNDALRHSFTGVLGDPIADTAALTEYIASYNFDIPADYNVNNLEIVAMVVDSNNNAKNGQYAHVGELEPYE